MTFAKEISMTASDVKNALMRYASDSDALFLQRFFKTGEGQYGAGDVFIGVRVPMTRKVCIEFKDLPLVEIKVLLQSPVHEHRLAAVLLMTYQFERAQEVEQKRIFDAYLVALDQGYINNWDIVDTSAEFIVGEYLWARSRKLLYELAKSKDVWHRRVAVLSSFAFIKKGDPSTTLELAEVLLHDPHDLIQKAVGWMLREIGKRIDRQILLDFLERHATAMPRTMLRYAIEHLTIEQKMYFMKKQ